MANRRLFRVVDGYARPNETQFDELAKLSNLLVIPTPPDAISLRVLARSIGTIQESTTPYKILITLAPPKPSREAEKAREDLAYGSIPTFKTIIPRSMGFVHGARDLRIAWNTPGFNHLKKPFENLRKEILK